ncbi:MAG TPA: hypothetical protein VMV52_03720 [Candidatus Nanopelagicaceae bacterium]|nr:hypothetical protein [Candidatus Nanopelagicaceae bacterium]
MTSFEAAAFRGARLPALIAISGLVVIFWSVKGTKGAIGALIGGSIALVFFAIHLIVSKVTRRADPAYVMALAFASYFAKLLVLLLFLVSSAGTKAFDPIAFAVSTLVVSVAWLAGEVLAYIRRG